MVLIVISVRIATTVNPKRCSEMRGVGWDLFLAPRGDSAATGTETPTTSTEMRQLFNRSYGLRVGSWRFWASLIVDRQIATDVLG